MTPSSAGKHLTSSQIKAAKEGAAEVQVCPADLQAEVLLEIAEDPGKRTRAVAVGLGKRKRRRQRAAGLRESRLKEEGAGRQLGLGHQSYAAVRAKTADRIRRTSIAGKGAAEAEVGIEVGAKADHVADRGTGRAASVNIVAMTAYIHKMNYCGRCCQSCVPACRHCMILSFEHAVAIELLATSLSTCLYCSSSATHLSFLQLSFDSECRIAQIMVCCQFLVHWHKTPKKVPHH